MNKRLVNLIFGISLGILLVVCLLTFDRLNNFNKYTNIVEKSNKVLLTIANLRSGFNTSIAEQRTYLITKDISNYNNFQSEKDSLRHTIQLFKKLTHENKVHQYYINKLEDEANNRIQTLLLEILNDTSTARYKFKQLDLIRKNDAINNNYDKILNTIHAHETHLLTKRLRLKEFEEQFTPILLFILALIAIGILAYAFVIISAELRKRGETTALLKESVSKLNESNKDLEQYAYVASHDLQEPLRKIQLFSDKLMSSYSDKVPAEALDMLKRINKSAERMTVLIKDLLSLSRLHSAKTAFESINLNNVLVEIENEFEEIIRTEGISISYSELPEIYGNASQIHQLFQNLIGNAIKFRRDDIPSEISIRYYEISKWIGDTPVQYHHLVIRDNGKGFDNGFKEKMFTIFGRLEKTAGISGTGIGLSICNRIMQNHEGEIDAEGKPNDGATFHLYFPIYYAE